MSQNGFQSRLDRLSQQQPNRPSPVTHTGHNPKPVAERPDYGLGISVLEIAVLLLLLVVAGAFLTGRYDILFMMLMVSPLVAALFVWLAIRDLRLRRRRGKSLLNSFASALIAEIADWFT